MDSSEQPSGGPSTKVVKKRGRKKKAHSNQYDFAESTVRAILAAKKDTAKRIYIDYGPGRTIEKVRQAIIDAVGPVSESSLRHWCSHGKWLEAAQEYDLKAAESDHQTLAKLREIAQIDVLAALDLARSVQINELTHVAMRPQDRKALSQTIKDLTTVIETLRAPDSSLSRDKATQHSGNTNVTVKGDVNIYQNRAIALLDKIALPAPAQVIDVVPTQVSAVEPAETTVPELENAPVQQPAAEPEPAGKKLTAKRAFGVEIHRLAELAAKDHVSFSEALEKLKRGI
jgi:uncharacterized protein YeaO (DUF488 family)